MGKSYITFDARSTSTNKGLGLEVMLDNDVIYSNDSFISAETIKIELPNDEAEHALKIILKNKTADHTVLDPLGAIVQDVNIVIENVRFEGVAVGFNVIQLATYTHDRNGTDELKEYKFYGEMGCNGSVELKFTTPIYLWLLEHM